MECDVMYIICFNTTIQLIIRLLFHMYGPKPLFFDHRVPFLVHKQSQIKQKKKNMSESKYIAESKDYSDKASYNREEKSRPIAIAEEKSNNSTSSKNNKSETKSTIDAKLEILLEDQAEVDAEFEALKLSPSKLANKVNDNPVAKKIAQGL